jgi:hypothetical protein
MPIVTQCTAQGCDTLTMGPLCVEHDSHVERVFVRGRPFARPALELRLTKASAAFAPTVRTASERAVAVPSLR